MSRRKQAKPRALKREEDWESDCGDKPPDGASAVDHDASVVGDSGGEQSSDAGANYDTSMDALQLALLERRGYGGGLPDSLLDGSRRGSPGETDNSLESEARKWPHCRGGNGLECRNRNPKSTQASAPPPPRATPPTPKPPQGNSSRLELLIEKIQANKENHDVLKDALGTSSWRSETPEEEGQTSPSPSSSATDVADADLAFTVGVTEGTPYACQFCDKAFPRLSYLKKHEQTHSDQMPFRCEFCSRLFKHKRSRDRHIKLHTGDKKYRCSHCEAAFSRSDHLKIHMKTHDNQKPFQCTVCNRGYNTAAALTSHMQNHKKESVGTPSPGSTFRCLSCGEAFRKPDDLQSHMASHHGSPGLGAALLTPKLACIYCTKDSFTTMEALQLHVQAMHGAIVNGDFSSPAASPTQAPPTPPPPPPPLPPPSLPFACDLCTMRFSSPSGLHKHAAAVHCAEQLRPTDLSKKGRAAGGEHHHAHGQGLPAAKRLRGGAEQPATTPYEHPGTLLCNQCSAALPDFEAFRTHLKSHLLEETAGAVCRHCGAAFAGAEALWRHVASHFLATASEFGCQSCLKQFRQPDDLQRHLLELHALHLYRCALCQELFESKVAIQVHFAVAHSSESRLFRCTACPGAAFRAEADFALHVRAAHAASPAAPATPPPSQQQQQQHAVAPSQQQQQPPPPFRCLYCRLSFGSELEMQFHLAAHSKQFRCPVCHEAFHVEFLLDKHMASHHAAQILNGNSSTPENLSHLQQQKSPKSKTNPARTSSGGSSSSDAPTSGVGDAELSSDAASVAASTTTTTATTLDKLSKAKGGGSSNKGGAGAAAAGVSLHCAYCSENCKSRTELENHMKTHSQGGAGGVGGKHKCNICDELCPSAAVLAEHKLTHCKVVSGNSCTQCKAALASEEQFVAHLRQHGGVGDGAVALPTPCVVCRQTLMSDVEVRVHAKFHLQQQPPPPAPPTAQCCLCLRAVELPGAGLCADCAAPRKAAAAAFRCLHCAASFESERDVQRHVSAAHGHGHGLGDRHECHLCRRGLDSPRQLQAHLIEHTFAGCGSFTCYLCSAVFTAAPGLQQHMLAHGPNARPYDCARCGLRFFFRAELDNHSYSHLERDEEIATKMAYYQHLNNNGTSEVAAKGKGRKGGGVGGHHACPDCGKEFSAARGLASHVRTAHPQVKREGVHACGVCSKEFLDVATLESHVAALHPTVKQEPPSPPPPPAATTPATAHAAAHDDADV